MKKKLTYSVFNRHTALCGKLCVYANFSVKILYLRYIKPKFGKKRKLIN